MAGGWFIWAFRDAVSKAGYYSTGKMARSYYERLAKEIYSACENGFLTCNLSGFSFSPFLPPWNQTHTATFLFSLPKVIVSLIRFDEIFVGSFPSKGPASYIALAETITHERAVPIAENNQFTLQGWAFAFHGDITVRIVDTDGKPLRHTFIGLVSDDVYNYYKSKNDRVPETARRARFRIVVPCAPKECDNLFIQFNKEEVEIKLPLTESLPLIAEQRGDDINFVIDSAIMSSSVQFAPARKLSLAKSDILSRIAIAYQTLIPILLFLSLIIAMGVGALAGRKNHFEEYQKLRMLIIAVCAVGISSLVFVLALIDATSFPATHTNYLAPLYPLLILAVFLTLSFFRTVWQKKISYQPVTK